jgi:deoxyribodipyrimidine photo-lyase
MSNLVKQYNKSLFIFRRDLRLRDNTGLLQALACSTRVLPCFIFDSRQITSHPYQGQPALQFMLESIADLRECFHVSGADLAIYQGLPTDILSDVVARLGIEAVFVNRDYSPFSRKRDAELAEQCRVLGIDFYQTPDCLLNEPEAALKADGSPYKVFTAFYTNARRFPVALPADVCGHNFMADNDVDSAAILSGISPQKLSQRLPGGRRAVEIILARLNNHADYAANRDYPAVEGTSKLSPHLKFGTCSVREVYYAIVQKLGAEHPLLRQLYWRDFFSHIAFHFPHVFGKAFYSRYDNLQWDNNLDNFNCWAEGRTGFPIVDAGMRELNATGFMHNRVRMVVASFLTKDLHISWRWGERYFAQHLVDYDPAVNNGNWQWAASTGCDAQPYFRIFNPWAQQQKFDPQCRYIKQWLPEVANIEPKILHNWHNKHEGTAYPAPIVSHGLESPVAKERYRQMT